MIEDIMCYLKEVSFRRGHRQSKNRFNGFDIISKQVCESSDLAV